MSRIVLTGATGFIGRHLLRYLAQQPELRILIVVRRPVHWELSKQVSVAVLADFRDESGWAAILQQDDLVIHLAGLAHRDLPAETQVEGFFEANVATTRAIARAGVQKQIGNFILISSIGVYGSSRADIVQPASALHPDQPYAESKLAAELALLSVAGRRYSCTILRLPLVYGADAPGNFGKLLRLVSLGIPLPFAGAGNKKSFISIDTLNQILGRLVKQPFATDQTLIAAEPQAVALSQLLQTLSEGMGQRSRLFYLPAWLLKLLLSCAGQKKVYKKLCLSLEADGSELFRLLDWSPAETSVEKVARIAAAYKGRSA